MEGLNSPGGTGAFHKKDSKAKALPCLVTVSSSRIVDGQREDTSLKALGLWDSEGRELFYEEYINDDGECPVTTRLCIDDGRIFVYRDGALQFEFAQKETTRTLYATPFGEIPMEVATGGIEADIGTLGGRVCIDYTLTLAPDTRLFCSFDIAFSLT